MSLASAPVAASPRPVSAPLPRLLLAVLAGALEEREGQSEIPMNVVYATLYI